jgi:hypothetical protein
MFTTRHACLAASVLFLGLALLIARLAVAPLGAADLLGIAACAAAAGAFATLAFTLRPESSAAAPVAIAPVAPAAAPVLDTAALAEQIATAVDARLAASEERRREELLRAAASAASSNATSPSDSRPPLSTDHLGAPAAASAKPRLGRGLASLIHNPAALAAKPPAPESEPRAGGEDERAAA